MDWPTQVYSGELWLLCVFVGLVAHVPPVVFQERIKRTIEADVFGADPDLLRDAVGGDQALEQQRAQEAAAAAVAEQQRQVEKGSGSSPAFDASSVQQRAVPASANSGAGMRLHGDHRAARVRPRASAAEAVVDMSSPPGMAAAAVIATPSVPPKPSSPSFDVQSLVRSITRRVHRDADSVWRSLDADEAVGAARSRGGASPADATPSPGVTGDQGQRFHIASMLAGNTATNSKQVAGAEESATKGDAAQRLIAAMQVSPSGGDDGGHSHHHHHHRHHHHHHGHHDEHDAPHGHHHHHHHHGHHGHHQQQHQPRQQQPSARRKTPGRIVHAQPAVPSASTTPPQWRHRRLLREDEGFDVPGQSAVDALRLGTAVAASKYGAGAGAGASVGLARARSDVASAGVTSYYSGTGGAGSGTARGSVAGTTVSRSGSADTAPISAVDTRLAEEVATASIPAHAYQRMRS